MTDKVQKIRQEVGKLKSNLIHGACSSQVAMETRCKEEAYNEVLALLDTMQEEPVSGLDNGDMPIERWKQSVKAASNQRNYRSSKGLTETRDDYFVDGVQWADEHPKKEHVSEEWIEELRTKLDSMSKEEFRTVWEKYGAEYEAEEKEEPVSEDLEKAEKEWLTPQLDKSYADYGETKMMELTHFDGYAMLDAIEFGAKWQKTKDESTTEDLGEYIDELSKQFPEVSFAKLSRIAVRVAKWQKEHLWKPADGDDLPEIDREVIALTQPYPNDEHLKVVFAHRPNNKYAKVWNSDLGEEQVIELEWFGKGGWNIPNIKYWLDVELPKEIEL